MPLFVQAGPVLVNGTPGDSSLATPSGPSPNLNNILLTFASLTDGTTYTNADPFSQSGVTISSPDGLTVLPYSTQSNPNYLYDDGANGDGDGTADIIIKLTSGVTAIGVGIADADTIG